MYNDIVEIYDQIFPINVNFLLFLQDYLPNDAGQVLDLGCGPGDVVDILTREGFYAVGIDNSEKMIAYAKTTQEGIFYPYGFDEINRLEGQFDFVYCVGNSFSYLPNDKLDEFLVNIVSLLSEGGLFLIQVVNWDRFIGSREINFAVKTISDGRTFHRKYEEGEGGTVIFRTALKIKDQVIQEWQDVLYPKTRPILEKHTASSGLFIEAIYGDYNKEHFNPESSPALILVVKK